MKHKLESIIEIFEARFNYNQSFMDARKSLTANEDLQEYWSNLIPNFYSFSVEANRFLFDDRFYGGINDELRNCYAFWKALEEIMSRDIDHEEKMDFIISFYGELWDHAEALAFQDERAKKVFLEDLFAYKKSLGKSSNPVYKAFEKKQKYIIKDYDLIFPEASNYLEATELLRDYILHYKPEFAAFLRTVSTNLESNNFNVEFNKIIIEPIQALVSLNKTAALLSLDDSQKAKIASFTDELRELKGRACTQHRFEILWDYYKQARKLAFNISQYQQVLNQIIVNQREAQIRKEKENLPNSPRKEILPAVLEIQKEIPLLGVTPLTASHDDDGESEDYSKVLAETFNAFREKKRQQKIKKSSSSTTSDVSSDETSDDGYDFLRESLSTCREKFEALFGNDLKKKFTVSELEYMLKRAGAEIDNSREGCRKRIRLKHKATDLMDSEVEVKQTFHGKHASNSEKFLARHSVLSYRAIFERAGITPEKLWPLAKTPAPSL